jgi:hypothetical protein
MTTCAIADLAHITMHQQQLLLYLLALCDCEEQQQQLGDACN